jgi:hypothetical protein
MNNIEQLKENIRQYIRKNGNREITGEILQEILLAMVDELADGGVIDTSLSLESENPVQNKAIKAALDCKVNTEPGKGLSTNDFTNELKNKLNNMPYITAYDYQNHRVTLNDGNGHSQVYQLTPYVPTPDYYVGFANSSTANFQAMTKEQLMALVGNGKTVDSNPSHSGTWDEYILFVLKRTNVSITSATFTSIAGGGAQQLELATMHDNITVDGTTYNVVGKRLGVFNAGQDTFKINFSKQ